MFHCSGVLAVAFWVHPRGFAGVEYGAGDFVVVQEEGEVETYGAAAYYEDWG